jgi:glycerate dehydrogenase
MKIIVLDGFTENPGDLTWDPISRYGEIAVYDRTPASEVANRIGDAEMALTNKALITKDVIRACPNLRYIGVLATGYNVVDVEAAKEAGIVVTNIPFYGTPAVVQHTIALLLELTNHVGHHNDTVQVGRWQNNIDWCYWDHPLVELQGKTLGIIGYGHIGRAVADVALAFGMKVVINSRTKPSALKEGVKWTELDDLFAIADFITLHCPLTDENRGVINKENIAKMKDGVYIINTGRGPLINEADLAEMLTAGKVGGAAMDVLTQEPPANGSPLIGLPNCILTPHQAWATHEARARLMDIAADNIGAFVDGNPVNRVNP